MKLKAFGFFRKTMLTFSLGCLVLKFAGSAPVLGEVSREKAVVETEKVPETQETVHPETITRNGIQLRLVKAEPHRTVEKNRKTAASCERERDSSEEEHPDAWNVSLEDPLTKRRVSDIIPYARTYEKEAFWEDDLFFEMTLKETGTDLVSFNNTTFPYDEKEPIPEELYDEVLRTVGLSPEEARITAVTWRKGVNRDGSRTACVEGETCHHVVMDVFEGEVKLPDITMVSFTLYYEEPEEDFLIRTGTEADHKAASSAESGRTQENPQISASREEDTAETERASKDPSGTAGPGSREADREKTEPSEEGKEASETARPPEETTEGTEGTADSKSSGTPGNNRKSEDAQNTGKSEDTKSTGKSEDADRSGSGRTTGSPEKKGSEASYEKSEGTGTEEAPERSGRTSLKGIIASVSGIAGTLGLGALGVLCFQYRKKHFRFFFRSWIHDMQSSPEAFLRFSCSSFIFFLSRPFTSARRVPSHLPEGSFTSARRVPSRLHGGFLRISRTGSSRSSERIPAFLYQTADLFINPSC